MGGGAELIQHEFKVNINGMTGGASIYEVIKVHRLACEGGGGAGLACGGDSVAAASEPGWTLGVSVCVCVCVPQLMFSTLPSLLTNPPPRAQAAQTQQSIRSGALPNSAAAEASPLRLSS